LRSRPLPNNAGARNPSRRANSARLSPDGRLQLNLLSEFALRAEAGTVLRETASRRASVLTVTGLFMAESFRLKVSFRLKLQFSLVPASYARTRLRTHRL